MMGPVEPIQLIGRMVKDKHGRQLGMVVSVLTDHRGDVSWVLVMMGDGRFRKFRLSDISLNNNSEVVVHSSLKKEVEALRRKAALLRKESKFLMDLKEKVDVSFFEEMGVDLENSVEELQREARELMTKAGRALRAVVRQIRDVRKGLACLAVEYELGRLSEESFNLFRRMLMNGLRWLVEEKKDIEEAMSMLQRLLEEQAPVREEPIEVEVRGTTDVIGT